MRKISKRPLKPTNCLKDRIRQGLFLYGFKIEAQIFKPFIAESNCSPDIKSDDFGGKQ